MQNVNYDSREELVDKGRRLHSEAVFKMIATILGRVFFLKRDDSTIPLGSETNCKA